MPRNTDPNNLSTEKLRELLLDNELDLSSMQIEVFPHNAHRLGDRLKNLDLSNNKLTYLPDSVGQLVHLTQFFLLNNQLTRLPDTIGMLTKLKHLSLGSNKLEDLPDGFKDLKALKSLDLRNNPLNKELLKIAGTCGDEYECYQCAKNVMKQYIGPRVAKLEKDLDKQNRLKQEREARIAKQEEAAKQADIEARKKLREQRLAAEKEAAKQNAAKSSANEHKKAPKPLAKEPSLKKTVVAEKKVPQSRGCCRSLLAFVWKVFFYSVVALAASSTVAIALDCNGLGSKIPGSAPLCRDFSLIRKGREPSPKFGNNLVATYSQVLHGYHQQVLPHWTPIRSKVQLQWKQFAKSDIGGKIEKAVYQVHSWIVEKFVQAQRFVKKQSDAVESWWKKSGKKQYGHHLDGFLLGMKMFFDAVINIVTVVAKGIVSAVGYVWSRAERFVETWMEKGFSQAFATLNGPAPRK